MSERVGLAVSRLRKRQGMSQGELANAAGLSRSFVCDIERGRSQPSLDTLVVIAQALAIPPSQVVAEWESRSLAKCRHWLVTTNGNGTGRCSDCGEAFILLPEGGDE